MNARYRSTFRFEGKRYECTGKTQKEADQKAAVKMDKLKRGEGGVSSNMTVSSWAREWLSTYRMPTVGKGQIVSDMYYVNKIICPSIGALRLPQVKDVHLQRLLNERAGKSKSDVKKLRGVMSGIFKRAYLSRLIQHNPAENLELPAATEGTHRRITDYERSKILQVAETHPSGLMVKLMLYTGIRPNEARALDWRHVDFEKQLLRVEVAMKSKTTIIAEPKTAAGVRNIPINDDLLRTLQENRDQPFTPVVVKPQSRKRHDEKSMRMAWRNFKRHLDISMGARVERNKIILSIVACDLVMYCLRHTYCTDLQDAGVPINIAKYLMGHSDISVTAKIYTHTTDAAIEDAARRINEAMIYRGGKDGGKPKSAPIDSAPQLQVI